MGTLHPIDRRRCSVAMMIGSASSLDSVPKQSFADIARLAAELCRTAHAVVCLNEADQVRASACYSRNTEGARLAGALCAPAPVSEGVHVVPDLQQDPQFSHSPLTAAVRARFSATVPLRTAQGAVLGWLCVLDPEPRPDGLTVDQQACLASLGRQAVTLVELGQAVQRNKAQEILQARILDSATDYAIIAMDRNGRVTRWNTGAERILGWHEDEMLGDPAHVFFTPEDRAAGRPEIEMALALRDGRASDERWHLRKGGERFWASGEMMPLTAEDGTQLGFLKIVRDRTQQQNDAAVLHDSEMRFRSLVEVSPQVVWFGDAAGNLTYCNPTWCAYTGLTPAASSGDGWASAIHPDHRERVLGVWRHAVATGGHYEVEIPLRRASDGQYRWFLARGKPVRNAAGALESWIGIALDIHERRSAEQRFQALTELSPAIIWFGNPDGSLSYLNDRWYEYTGQTPSEALPLGWSTVIHPDDLSGLLQSWEEARSRETLYDTEARLRRHDGTYRWFLIRAEPQRDEAGKIFGWLGSNSDIHDRKHAEEALQKAQDKLRLAIAATDIGIFDYDLITGDLGWDARVCALFGLSPDAPISYDVFLSGLHPDDRDWVDRAVQAALDPASGGMYDIAYRTIGLSDGVERWIAAQGQVIFERGRAVRFIGTARDISDVKRAEEHQRLLAGELQHRIKNTLAMVQAIANQTLRGATDLDEAREAFAGRLISLGRAHDILTQASWTAAPIIEVIEGALCVHRHASVPRIRTTGPDVQLAAKPALSLALALHELATNAAKYGALSNESGFVELRWNVVHEGAAPRFCLTWSEHGGPPILSEPTRRGFGSRLIARSFTSEMGGAVSLTYAPTGLVCRIEAPLASMQEQKAMAAA